MDVFTLHDFEMLSKYVKRYDRALDRYRLHVDSRSSASIIELMRVALAKTESDIAVYVSVMMPSEGGEA